MSNKLWLWPFQKSVHWFPGCCHFLAYVTASDLVKSFSFINTVKFTGYICYYYYIRLVAFFLGQPGQAGTRKVNHSGFYWSKRWWGDIGISWTICKSFAPLSRQITTPVPHHSVFTGRMQTNSIKALKAVMLTARNKQTKLECGPMPNVMVALPNVGGALCSTPQSLACAHCSSVVP